MNDDIRLEEKYERHGWPAIQRPDLKPPEGWSLSLINSVNLIHEHQLSPDGERIAFNWHRESFTDVYVMPTTGGWPQRATLERGPTVYWLDSPPQWSPDGRWLATTVQGHVHVLPGDGRGLSRNVTDFTGSAWAPVWMPDSHGLIVTVERNDATQLLLTNREGGWPRALTKVGNGDDMGPQPSPDGRLMTYVHRPFADLNRLDVCLVEMETGQKRVLVGAPKQKNWSPRWSPDGQLIAFLSQRPDFNEVWLIGPDGNGLRQLTHLGRDVGEFAWSPDGRTLAATINRGGAMDLALIAVETGEVTDVSPSGGTDVGPGKGIFADPQWHPSGDSLLVQYEDPTSPPDLYRVELPDGRIHQLTFSNPPALTRHELVVPEAISYPSFDGLEIPAFLYRPAQPNGAAILRPHGGPTDQYRYDWDILAQYFVAKGYTFLAPNFRGSTGYGLTFEHANYDNWGVGDTQDCLHGASFLGALDGIDPERIGIFGSSYGGYLVGCCLARDPDHLFACGVSKYGDANLYSSWAQCERETRLYTEMQIGHPVRNWQVYVAGSPILHVDNIQKPILLLHGLKDDIVPPQSSEEWAEALRQAGKTFEYKTYAGEPHGFLKRETELDWQRRMERFFDWYLRA